MAVLSARHETFCRTFVMNSNATRAAIDAGYSRRTARQQGSRLLGNAAVQERIGQLRAEVARRHCLDADTLMAKLEAVYRRALENHHFYAANRAVELQGRLAGAFPEPAPRAATDATDGGSPAGKPGDVVPPPPRTGRGIG
jgi:hypothetical protein